MCAIHSLQICLRVPIAVKEDDNVGGNKVDTETTSTSGEQEDELFAVRCVVVVDCGDTVLMSSVTVDSAVL